MGSQPLRMSFTRIHTRYALRIRVGYLLRVGLQCKRLWFCDVHGRVSVRPVQLARGLCN